MSIDIIWGRASSFNHGRVGDTGVRVERYRIRDESGKEVWRLLLADEDSTYMHVDSNNYLTVADLEKAAIDWLVKAGRIEWLQ